MKLHTWDRKCLEFEGSEFLKELLTTEDDLRGGRIWSGSFTTIPAFQVASFTCTICTLTKDTKLNMNRCAILAVLIGLFVFAVDAKKYMVLRGGSIDQLKVISEDEAPLRGFEDMDVMVTGEYNSTLLLTGWDTLRLETNKNHSDWDQAYSAGYFEGQVTYLRAWQLWSNHFSSNPVPKNILDFFDDNAAYIKSQVLLHNATDPYWYHVGLMWRQFEGLMDGLNIEAVVNQTFTFHRLISLTALGDLFDLRAALQLDSDEHSDWRTLTKPEFERWFIRNSHCSALFKVSSDLSEIFFGHTSWYDYTATTRIYKILTLNFNDNITASRTISFSSYPGMLSSFDDFYLTDTGIAAIETSVEVLNQTMYNGNINPTSVLYWARVMISTRTATSAEDWARKIAVQNSGTYNNQYVILDLKKFTPGQDLQPGTLWIAEQFPGIVKSRDVTDILAFGYYPSYNIPQDRELFWLAGYGEAVAQFGPEMNDYETCVRAQIFRRDQGLVSDLSSFQHLLRYNDYEQDPISQGNPVYAIAARGDLDPNTPGCFGALDAKVSSFSLWKSGQIVLAQSGPTMQQPIFEFAETAAPCGPHVGLPEVYNFNWQTMVP